MRPGPQSQALQADQARPAPNDQFAARTSVVAARAEVVVQFALYFVSAATRARTAAASAYFGSTVSALR
jgi:hypothetical protein